jgi:hypothetical protein
LESLRNLGAAVEMKAWREEVEAWEEDDKKSNPFASKVERKTVVDVRREMASDVQKEITKDAELEIPSEEMHRTELIGMGLQLEELQRVISCIYFFGRTLTSFRRNLAFDVAGLGNHPSAEQQTNMTERTNKLRRKLLTWMDSQVLFMPHVALLRAEEDRARMKISATRSQPGIQVQHMALWLPSAIKGGIECDVELYEYEFRLRLWTTSVISYCCARTSTSTKTVSRAG